MAYFTAQYQPPATVCRNAVRAADVYVLIAGFRYGSTAAEAGIPVLVFVLAEDAIGPALMFRDSAHGARQDAFRARLLDSGVTVASVTSPEQLATRLLQALHTLQRPGPTEKLDGGSGGDTGNTAMLADLARAVEAVNNAARRLRALPSDEIEQARQNRPRARLGFRARDAVTGETVTPSRR